MTTSLRRGAWDRILAIVRKDAAELIRRPGAILPAVMMVAGALIPAFLVVIGVPMIAGESLAESGEFAEEALAAINQVPELGGLVDSGLIQAFLFHQFALLLLLVPVVGAMALATHAVIGEKQARALEPLLATPISTLELLAAKTFTPFVFAVGLMWMALVLYVAGIAAIGEPGVWLSLLGVRSWLMFGLLGPLVALAALLLSVIVSSRANDPRSAQQLASLMILPITAIFVGQMMGAYIVGPGLLVGGGVGFAVLDGLLLWLGVRVFQRETILTRWR